MWKRGLLREFEDDLTAVAHRGQDPKRTRNQAADIMMKKMTGAKARGEKAVIHRIEGRTKKDKAGDPAIERLMKKHGKRIGIKVKEKSLEVPESEWGVSKKTIKVMKARDKTSRHKRPKGVGEFEAHPGDDPSGEQKPTEVTKQVARGDKGRRKGWTTNVEKDKAKGHTVLGGAGEGHFSKGKRLKGKPSKMKAKFRKKTK